MSHYTPRPWKCISTSKHYFDFRIVKPDGSHFDHDGSEAFFQEAYAIGRAIDALPDLYTSLKWVIDEAKAQGWDIRVTDNPRREWLNRAAAAIAKAEGRS